MAFRLRGGPALFPLAAAVLFGVTTPVSKLLVTRADPLVLAGVFYVASGLALALGRAVDRRARGGAVRETPLAPADLPWLAGAVVAGGVAAPVLLLVGLRATSAAAASLLLNLEVVFTVALARLVFGEPLGPRVGWGTAAIVTGCAVLSWPEGSVQGGFGGLAAVTAACLGWAVDNNLTRQVSGADPLAVAAVKGLAAGAVNLALAAWLGRAVPAPGVVGAAAVVGAAGYGASLVLFVYGLRHLGAARTVGYFSLAPFVGAGAAVVALGEAPGWGLAAGGALAALGVWLHLGERHEHLHVHREPPHDHPHAHDAHHGHPHPEGGDPGHRHLHDHRGRIHRHPHVPDIHHRHRH
ncbi:MAG: DMT family transporter [Deferrisomatales bacterium]